ncbi:hypothetical protein [Chitinophaga sp. sic0106]|uniref:hypothetical protein n=1 Tax=Chitinophaga sp. sic0106 TaxID=2854785 RepID=UPI001C44658C|nr:hypothetical protein [Chitinophaga sp. sic0106]
MTNHYTMVQKILPSLFILAFGFFGCGPKEDPMKNPRNRKALYMVQDEAKVTDAKFIDNILYVKVIDDGTRRDGYAQYLCLLLREYRSTIHQVKVVNSGPGSFEEASALGQATW